MQSEIINHINNQFINIENSLLLICNYVKNNYSINSEIRLINKEWIVENIINPINSILKFKLDNQFKNINDPTLQNEMKIRYFKILDFIFETHDYYDLLKKDFKYFELYKIGDQIHFSSSELKNKVPKNIEYNYYLTIKKRFNDDHIGCYTPNIMNCMNNIFYEGIQKRQVYSDIEIENNDISRSLSLLSSIMETIPKNIFEEELAEIMLNELNKIIEDDIGKINYEDVISNIRYNYHFKEELLRRLYSRIFISLSDKYPIENGYNNIVMSKIINNFIFCTERFIYFALKNKHDEYFKNNFLEVYQRKLPFSEDYYDNSNYIPFLSGGSGGYELFIKNTYKFFEWYIKKYRKNINKENNQYFKFIQSNYMFLKNQDSLEPFIY